MVHFQKRIVGQFFIRKKTKPGGGGVEGGLANHHTFPQFFWETIPINKTQRITLLFGQNSRKISPVSLTTPPSTHCCLRPLIRPLRYFLFPDIISTYDVISTLAEPAWLWDSHFTAKNGDTPGAGKIWENWFFTGKMGHYGQKMLKSVRKHVSRAVGLVRILFHSLLWPWESLSSSSF